MYLPRAVEKERDNVGLILLTKYCITITSYCGNETKRRAEQHHQIEISERVR